MLSYTIFINNTNKKFNVYKNNKKFKLYLGNIVVSEANYNIENKDDYFNEKYLTINTVHTIDRFKGKGYAKLLFNEIFDYVKNNLKLNIITLIVYKDNTPAVKLYFKLGFDIFMEYDNSYCLIEYLNK